MAIRKKLKGGFTLVELMIVVAIVGVLAVLAVYGVRKYIANAKTAEAKNSLGQMGKDAVTAFEGERMTAGIVTAGASTDIIRRMCATGAAVYAPGGASAGVAKVKGAKYQSLKSDWSNTTDVKNNAGFPCLKFEMTQPQYYVYGYTGSTATAIGTQFTATANGDLNGDGVISTFQLLGEIQSGSRLVTAPSIGEVSPEE